MQREPAYPINPRLVVVIRDDGPMAILQEPPTKRHITIPLTTDQINQLALTYTYQVRGDDCHEVIAECWIEQD